MMRFNQSPESREEMEVSQVGGVPVALHQQLLRAEIEFRSGGHPQALRLLAEILPQADSLGALRDFLRAIVDHNVALVLAHHHKPAAAQLLLRKTLKYFTNTEDLSGESERQAILTKCRENFMLAGLMAKAVPLEGLYESIKDSENHGSYKISYRKA